MKTPYLIFIVIITLLGIAHTILGFNIYTSFDKDSFWFIGTGIALITSGIANYMNYRINIPLTLWCVSIINILILIFSSVLTIRYQHIPASLVAIFTAFLIISSYIYKKKSVTQWQSLRKRY